MYRLPYGKSFIQVPDLWNGEATFLSPGPFPDVDPVKTVSEALDEPLGGMELANLCRPGCRIACVIPDLTRRSSVRQYLPVLLEKLSSAGVSPGDVKIIVALGIHRAMTGPELGELVGEEVLQSYTVVNHDADNEEANVFLGMTDAGIPVEINRTVAEADLVILTGSVASHYFAGYGGGRKSMLPGVASRKACETHHKMVVSWRRGELEGNVTAGLLKGNPVHEQMIQACAFSPPIFVLNTITEPGGRIVGAAAGELEAAHLDACRKYDQWFKKHLATASRLVIAGSGGFPRDINFVQAHKGMLTAHQSVAEDGLVILAAQCGEGTGHADFLKWFDRCATEDRWLQELQMRYQINGQTAFSTWLRTTSIATVLVSSLDPQDVEKMGMIPSRDMVGALRAAEGILGELPVPLIIPDAGDILPVIRSQEEGIGNSE